MNPALLAGLLIAAAANTRPALETLKPGLARAAGEDVEIRYGATGTFERQIENGAPFDLFLAADEETPARLLRNGLLKSPRCYAVGALVLVRATDSPFVLPLRLAPETAAAFRRLPFRALALASPKSAPYGRAAREVLTKLKIPADLESRLVFAENVAQALTFVRSGNADAGFVSLSEALGSGLTFIPVAPSLYRPLRQSAGILTGSKHVEGARHALDFLFSEEARTVWNRHGYTAP